MFRATLAGMESIPAPPRMPEIPPPAPVAPPAPVVQVTPQQVWSAAAQNIVACVCVTVAWCMGKIDTSLALMVIAGVVGVDFAGRMGARGKGGAAMAMAFGASGVFEVAAKHFKHIVGSVLFALTLSGCAGSLPPIDFPKYAAELEANKSAYLDACVKYVKNAEVCAVSYDALEIGTRLYQSVTAHAPKAPPLPAPAPSDADAGAEE